ncbi:MULTISPECIES: alpha-glucosidase/alpha-galactosidase [unclassified Leifsonia]|uniref:alpha-glucosidase/alpha-galactosidase n=1 Tax=unclassified Leifsonia TaxID=2663824 RepID=UPI000700C828|nr:MULTISPECIES: alpha-glucosidase/alpha-galactosidase [unclassified Leifsonia]KQX08141.1 alpha-glucosidase/alpha-galactosidase [Leifsonia sp. Root1293]KRA12422.1 alpha-glucosidase/alpha-galactosidase [Leifsonia sp. Root60]
MPQIVFLGAGSVVFTRQLLADLARFDDLPAFTVVLHDIDAERLEVARGTAEQVAARFGRDVEVVATLDRRAALAGADFVVNMIQVGGIAATRIDLELPARAGIRQTIGDTTGVGGVFRALRTFPVLSGIANDMLELCPDAWFLNYTNPMAMNVWWMSLVAPSIKTVGLCHSVYWTVNDLCELIGVPLEGTHFRAAGVNHQAWLTEWSRDGESLYPSLREKIAADPELERRVRVEMFRRLGYYPTETSEHSAEYLDWFLRSDEQIERFRIEPLQYIGISEENVAEFEAAKLALAEGRQLELEEGAAEYAPQIIHSILTGTERVIHVNVVNTGLIDNLPQGTVVEVPATVDAAGVHPIAVGSIPEQGAALNRTYLSVAQLTIDAALTGDAELVRRAVLVDPNASSSITPEQIWALCDELTDAHADLLPTSLGGRVELALP